MSLKSIILAGTVAIGATAVTGYSLYLFGSHIQEYLENKAVQEESKLREEYGTPIIIHGNTDGGIAIGDITGDGHQDVIVTTSKDGVSKLYRLINDGKGNLIPFTSARE